MRALRNRNTAILALLAYTSAMVGAVCFHHHGHEHPQGSSCAIHSSASTDAVQHHCCAHHADRPGSTPEQKDHSPESPQPQPHSHDDCSICQFLVTKTICAAGISIGEQVDVVCFAEPDALPAPESPPLPLPPSRGPPWML